MVEPVLTAAAIATMMATKAFEKTGEKIGEAVMGSISKFLSALWRKDPKTADAIATVAQQPELAEQQPQDYGTAVLVAKVEEAAKNDISLKQVIEELATTARAQHPIINNLAQLQEKGILIQGGQPDFRGANITFWLQSSVSGADKVNPVQLSDPVPDLRVFQGRGNELSALTTWLTDPAVSMIGIRGQGGIDKSALLIGRTIL